MSMNMDKLHGKTLRREKYILGLSGNLLWVENSVQHLFLPNQVIKMERGYERIIIVFNFNSGEIQLNLGASHLWPNISIQWRWQLPFI